MLVGPTTKDVAITKPPTPLAMQVALPASNTDACDPMKKVDGKRMERRSTGKTGMTEETATVTSIGSSICAINNKNSVDDVIGKSDFLVRLIAKEMAASLLKESMDGLSGYDQAFDNSTLASFSSSESTRHSMDVDAIAEMVVNSIKRGETGQTVGSETAFRTMLREELAAEEDGSCGPELTTTDLVGTSLCAASQHTRSTTSDLSNATGGGRKVQMDIWHPDFWNDCGFEAVTLPERKSSNPGSSEGSRTSSNDAVNQYKRSNDSCSVSVNEFFVRQGHEISSSDSEGSSKEDDCSVLSDISGLTECFDSDNHIPSKPKARRFSFGTRTATTKSSSTADYESMLGSHLSSCASKTSSMSSSKQKRKKKSSASQRSVTFSEVQVRQYERILCENPACSAGPSIGIGWRFVEQNPLHVDEWEGKNRKGRSQSELLLSRASREKLIRKLGYSERDIAAAVRELNKVRALRRQTVNNLGAQKMEEAVESVRSKVKSILFLQRDSVHHQRMT